MIHIEFYDETFEAAYVPTIRKAYGEAAKLLVGLPDKLTVKFTEDGAEEQSGVGGFAESPRQLNIAVARNFSDTASQLRNLRAVVFHELFHINQGFTFEQSPFTALEAAIYEGCAVTFEREYGGGNATYADFSQHSEDELTSWYRQLENVGTEYFEDRAVWHKWAFYNPELNQKWIIYKVGVWLVGKIIEKNTTSTLELQGKSAHEISQLSIK